MLRQILSRPAATADQPRIQQWDAMTLKKRLDADEPIWLIDVRTPAEYAAGHLEHARLLPLFQLPLRALTELPQDRPLVLICRSGARSQAAAEQLARLGFQHLINLRGGVNDWQALGYPLVRH